MYLEKKRWHESERPNAYLGQGDRHEHVEQYGQVHAYGGLRMVCNKVKGPNKHIVDFVDCAHAHDETVPEEKYVHASTNETSGPSTQAASVFSPE